MNHERRVYIFFCFEYIWNGECNSDKGVEYTADYWFFNDFFVIHMPPTYCLEGKIKL